MESTDVEKGMSFGRKQKVCQPYTAPMLQRVDPLGVQSLFLLLADQSDTEFQQIIDSIDHPHEEKGS